MYIDVSKENAYNSDGSGKSIGKLALANTTGVAGAMASSFPFGKSATRVPLAEGFKTSANCCDIYSGIHPEKRPMKRGKVQDFCELL